MYKVWYWASVERESNGQFVARLYDMPDFVADGASEKEAIESLKVLAADYVRQLVESGQPPPQASNTSALASRVLSKEFTRALISVDVARVLARPSAKLAVKV